MIQNDLQINPDYFPLIAGQPDFGAPVVPADPTATTVVSLNGISGMLQILGDGTRINITPNPTTKEITISFTGTLLLGASGLVGDGASTTLTFTHNLGTTKIVVSIMKESDGQQQSTATWQATSANAVAVTFGAAPASNEMRVTVIGIP